MTTTRQLAGSRVKQVKDQPERVARSIESGSFCLEYLNADGKEIHWDFIRAALGSVGDTAIVPVQDLLGLGNEARMNLPNSTSGNWSWRISSGTLTDAIATRLRELTLLYGRA